MDCPFPGMDPYLEHRYRWQSFHQQFIARLPDVLYPMLPERYAVSVEEHVYLTVPGDSIGLRQPDAMVVDTRPAERERGGPATATVERAIDVIVPGIEPQRENYLEVRDLEADEQVVTVVELLSPTNKNFGSGRDEYLHKRSLVLSSSTSLVEIDLLRGGARMPMSPENGSDYGILVARAGSRPHAKWLPFSIRDKFPAFTLPLRGGDDEPDVDIGPIVRAVYRTNRLSQRIDYTVEPTPPLAAQDRDWADALLRDHGLR